MYKRWSLLSSFCFVFLLYLEYISFPSSPTSNRRKDFSSSFFFLAVVLPNPHPYAAHFSYQETTKTTINNLIIILLRYTFSPKYCLDTAIISLVSTTFFAATLQTPPSSSIQHAKTFFLVFPQQKMRKMGETGSNDLWFGFRMYTGHKYLIV